MLLPWIVLPPVQACAFKVIALLVLISALGHQIYYAFRTDIFVPLDAFADEPLLRSSESSFAACLLVKDDNDLLQEWLAYHYTVLPLRHILVGVDVNSTQDPLEILQRWHDTDLRYSVIPSEAFADRYPKRVAPMQDEKSQHHHDLVHRQKGFISVCSEHLKRKGAKWTAYIDTDEYVVPNRLGAHDQHLVLDGHDHFSMKNESFQIRKHLPSVGDSSATVADILIKLQEAGFVESCFTLPRLLVGALENRTCSDAQDDRMKFSQLSTLRYFQHSVKGDFQKSKFGKVFMDLSKIPVDTIRTVPRNIHRPYKDVCGPGSVHFPDSFFYTNHYIGSWERYSSRSDKRRNRDEWEKRAFLDDGTPACESGVYEWLPRFVGQVGESQANYLLGGGGGDATP